ncbi:MAG TPA: ATP-dependent DNA ligase, partial [Terriglobales bacterium]
IGGTTKKLEKKSLLAAYLKAVPLEQAIVAAVFFSGRPFPMWEETTLQVGGSSLWKIVQELSEKSESELSAAYRRHGDLGAVAGEVLPTHPVQDVPAEATSLTAIQQKFRAIAKARGPAAKASEVRDLLSRVTPLEAKYIIKIMTGDLRIGLKESLVEEAIAAAYDAPLAQVQRANMLLGDIGETLRYASEGKLEQARMRLFHPLGFMLASPAESAEDALSYFSNAWVEDKYDGIRAQAHCSQGEVKLFSRTRDEITESFPELPDVLAGLQQDVILDGEIVAWSYSAQESGEAGRALPFSALQQRLGRKKVSHELMRKVPVVFLVFDVLYAGESILIDRPLRERARILEQLLAERNVVPSRPRAGQATLNFDGPDAETDQKIRLIRAPVAAASAAKELDDLFEAAQARGNEGLMIKDPESAYTPGRRGKSWLKLKRELATLDVVVTAVEYGHGKRVGVLSDYTFAVWNGDRLVNIGKAYSGLTDAEIAEMTSWFLGHTIEDQGFRRLVEPKIVLEVAFNNMMRSDRHNSGFALRFPRIVRLRPDKLPEEADTIQSVQEIFEQQK